MPSDDTASDRTPPARPSGRQLCVVANRLPIEHRDEEGWQRSPGGLVAALEPALDASGGRWFGYSDVGGHPPPQHSGGIEYIALPIDARTRAEAIDGCCNRTLWPALHGVTGNIEQSPAWWSSYFAHNERTAAEVAARAQAGALIWAHDYHHFAMAGELKRLRRDLRIGLFCHTPLDGSNMARLSNGRGLLGRMADFDVIGTQTARDAGDLRSQFEQAGVGRGTPIHSVPVGIDVQRWAGYRNDAAVASAARSLAGSPGLLAVGVDRADYTKGLVAKFLAFEVALGRGSISADDLRLIQIATPTRSGIAAYDHVLTEIQEIAGQVNDSFARSDGRPVIEVFTESRAPSEVAALMTAADVMLITPLRDGMNLVALESSLVNANRPVEIILSRAAGAAAYIGSDCRLVTGADVLSIADELDAVVHRPSPDRNRRDRAERRARSVSMLSARRWVDTFTGLLGECELSHPVRDRAAPSFPETVAGA